MSIWELPVKNLAMSKLVLSIVFFFVSFNSYAVTSEFSGYFIPYERIQSGYTCLHKALMIGDFGIPLDSKLRGIFSKKMTLRESTNSYINTNLLVDGTTTIGHTLNFERLAGAITEYSFKLDLAAFNTLNGNTVSGRQKTINTAKLAIISIVKTIEQTYGAGAFRIWVQFDNLPSQVGLTGLSVFTALPDWPSWPYTSTSPLYNTYKAELISPSC